MTARPIANPRASWRIAGVLILASVWPAASAWGQGGTPPELPAPQATGEPQWVPARGTESGAIVDPNVVPAGCATCGSGLIGALAPPAPDGIASGGCSTCGDGCAGGCYPGRKKGYCCCCDDCDTCVGRMLCGIYHCICCPDPCYEPRWIATQDSAFFVDSARPITQLRIRGDGGFDVPTPDRAEFFWARERTTPNQAEPGPSPTNPNAVGADCFRHGFGKGPACIASSIDHEDLSLYTEAAIGGFSFFFEMPYQEVDPETAPNSFMLVPGKQHPEVFVAAPDLVNRPIPPNTPLPADVKVGPGGATITQLPGVGNAMTTSTGPAGTTTTTTNTARMFPAGTILKKGQTFPGYLMLPAGSMKGVMPTPAQMRQPAPCCNVSGFSDLNLGTKSVLLDCELLLLTFQFKTFLPTGDFTKGLGDGHVSLEPALLFALKLTPEMYLQGELAYWIPIGGDPLYEGDIFHEHYSLNQTLWCPCPGLRLVGTLEASHWEVLGGNFTSPDLLVAEPMMITKPNGKPGIKNVLAAPALSATTSMLSIGPGIRFFICDKIDIGLGTQFAVTADHWEEELIRAEFRWRF
jgi:hypothetical protein